MKRIFLVFFFLGMTFHGGNPPVSHASEDVTVVLDWFINPDHGPLFIALEKGFFTERGLNVEFQVPSNPNDPPKLAAASLGGSLGLDGTWNSTFSPRSEKKPFSSAMNRGP